MKSYKIEIFPAYGEAHRITLDDVYRMWNAGKDFKIVGGPYCSIRDFDQLKKDFDVIAFKWFNLGGEVCYHTMYICPLPTSYTDETPQPS